ncbi:hypothetical protein PanWU01x14_020110 [Parasponia andersonii]|uniref:Uncharacterized protein n=1 Tax=Parasponia andersonii TaxID=3476 RepID=A0A2P5DYM8_PARAD|nr:hypothetical protein PanWU01x14_020110 [Parasponia andersonii]
MLRAQLPLAGANAMAAMTSKVRTITTQAVMVVRCRMGSYYTLLFPMMLLLQLLYTGGDYQPFAPMQIRILLYEETGTRSRISFSYDIVHKFEIR